MVLFNTKHLIHLHRNNTQNESNETKEITNNNNKKTRRFLAAKYTTKCVTKFITNVTVKLYENYIIKILYAQD